MAAKPSKLIGFDQAFPTLAADDLARKLAELNAIALGELVKRLPNALRTRNPQEMENALKELKKELPIQFSPAQMIAISVSAANNLNRKNREQFFKAVSRAGRLTLINTDEPELAVGGVGGLFSGTIKVGKGKQPAMVKVNLNPGLFVEQFAKETTARISTLSAGVIDGTRDAIVREVMLGDGDPEALTQKLLAQWERNGVPSKIPTRRMTKAGVPVEVNVEAHAAFIARDQIGSLQMELTRSRQSEAGIKKFKWITRHDSRVRPSHQRRDGHVYTWVDGADGEFPGGPPNCRCHAQAVVDPLTLAANVVRP